MAIGKLLVLAVHALHKILSGTVLVFLLTSFTALAHAQILPSIADKVANANRMEGYFNLYWEEASGKMYREIDKLDTDFLYAISMASGLDSNPVERQAVRDAFAPSVLWGFDIIASTGDSVLVDATDFFLRDARDVIGNIADRNQGTYTLDKNRSAFYLENTKTFPENVEVEVMLTFASRNTGNLVNQVAASGESVTLRQRDVDFLTLPNDILALLPPTAYRRNQGEALPGRTGLLFDALAAAEGSANLTVQSVLRPERMARLVAYGSMEDYPDLEEVVDRLLAVTWGAEVPSDEYRAQVLRVVQRGTVNEMMRQASNDDISGEVKAILADRLHRLAAELEGLRAASPYEASASADIRRWQQRPDDGVPAPALQMPPGDPI